MVGIQTRGDALEPVGTGERLLALDVLRGLAILGVVIANMNWFSGLVFRFPAYRPNIQTLSLDSFVYHAIAIVVSGKAIATLSFLFGLGFSIQLLRSEERGVSIVPLYCRRLLVLLVIGVLHLVFVWYGDILSLYAVLGFALLWAARRSDRTLLIGAGVLLVGLPLAIGAFDSVSAIRSQSSSAVVAEPPVADVNRARLATFREGTYPDVIRENIAQGAFFYRGTRGLINLEYLGLFLLGLYVGRRRLLERAADHAATLRRVALWGIGVGLCGGIADVAVAIFVGRRAALSRPDLALLMSVISITTFVQAAGYVAAVTVLLQRPFWTRWLSVFAPAGRMALSNYLTQSVVFVSVFNGFGLGLIGRVDPAAGLAMASSLYALQMAASRLWLSRFRIGPMEWVWRSATYGRLQPLLNVAPPPTAYYLPPTA